jgi:16S rRNA (cytidine1402-2'-O)-methyltransferase
MMIPQLYLIPNSLGSETLDDTIPAGVIKKLGEMSLFFVENERNARRFLRKAGYTRSFDETSLHVLDEHTSIHEIEQMISLIREAGKAGIISEAGIPAVADPGAQLVNLAHLADIRVVPMSGPSSILMALMASGLNGQNFAFHGYLPVKQPERGKKIKLLEQQSHIEQQAQIFMETPYRNESLFKDLLTSLRNDTQLCVAADISLETEEIKTRSILEWKRVQIHLNKRPAMFVLQAG